MIQFVIVFILVSVKFLQGELGTPGEVNEEKSTQWLGSKVCLSICPPNIIGSWNRGLQEWDLHVSTGEGGKLSLKDERQREQDESQRKKNQLESSWASSIKQ